VVLGSVRDSVSSPVMVLVAERVQAKVIVSVIVAEALVELSSVGDLEKVAF
jgi:hypothetical protein